jgi:hypothetical protein
VLAHKKVFVRIVLAKKRVIPRIVLANTSGLLLG